jgi:murein L,D-transpeptidase YafK
VIVGLLWLAGLVEAGPPPCVADPAPHVLVRARDHRLWLCDQGRPARSYGVRLAKNGAGKASAGDGKIPLGAYPLGAPRPSKKYGTFIPIGYPTREQAARGLSGGSVGIHGPDRRVRWLGRLVNVFDTTDGCIGVATDGEMKEIAAWLHTARARRIRLE